jgi:hypothetical protein
MAKRKETRIINDLQNTTQKTKDWATRIPLTGAAKEKYSSCFIDGTRRVRLVTKPLISMNGPDCNINKWNTSVVICDTEKQSVIVAQARILHCVFFR